MGIKYSSFPIRGIDISNNNGIIDWSKVNAHFAITRVGYGRTIDSKFYDNWMGSKGKCKRSGYWFMDYYSNWYINPTGFVASARGLSDVEWGEEQAENCWNELKNDPEGIVWLDIENGGPSYSPPLTNPEAKRHALNIAWGFLQRIDELNGKRNGIYTSVGWLDWFTEWFKDRPLWVAWYPYRTSMVGPMAIVQMVIDKGWNVKPIIWQYASDGDVDDNGTPDGKTLFKTELKEMDLNGWVGTQQEYESMFSTSVADPIETPDDETVTQPIENARVVKIKYTQSKLNMRSSPKIGWNVIKTLPVNYKVDCLETIIDGQNIWQRVGIDQYVAEINNGITYLK